MTQELPVVKNELAWDASQVNSTGLLVTNSSDDADWDFYDPGKTGEVTEYNLLYYKALLDGATLATAAGDTTDAATYTSDAAALKTAINANLFESSTGLYYISNTQTGGVAQDANSLAVLYGVAPASDDATLLAALKTDLWTTPYGPEPFTGSTYSSVISPYVSGYEVDARLAASDTADAESLLETVWGDMINPSNPDDTGTMWENISAANGQVGFGAFSSLAHGWATTPVSALSGYVLGVQPATAGLRDLDRQPHPGDLSWAEGSVPTPHGSIAVDWAGQSGTGQFSMNVTAPSGTTGTIAVPTYGAANPIITVGGVVVWSNGAFTATTGITGASANGGYIDLTGVQPGTYMVASNPGTTACRPGSPSARPRTGPARSPAPRRSPSAPTGSTPTRPSPPRSPATTPCSATPTTASSSPATPARSPPDRAARPTAGRRTACARSTAPRRSTSARAATGPARASAAAPPAPTPCSAIPTTAW